MFWPMHRSSSALLGPLGTGPVEEKALGAIAQASNAQQCFACCAILCISGPVEGL